MPNLAVFDFDRTVVTDDSDSVIIRKVTGQEPPPTFDSSSTDWTPYMNDMMEQAFKIGLTPQEILDAIAAMEPIPGMVDLFKALQANGWETLLLTDSNSVFIEHWFKMQGLEKAVTQIVTNQAYWKDGRLFIEPNMHQGTCNVCPTNICKSDALSNWRAGRNYDVVAYAGDGRNDFCPATSLTKTDFIFARRGYNLERLIKENLALPNPEVVAKVVIWDDANVIIKTLFPDKMAGPSES